jgi:hypothetical protein
LDIYIGIYLKMHGPINVKSFNNASKWQMGFNSAFKGFRDMRVKSVHASRAFKQ